MNVLSYKILTLFFIIYIQDTWGRNLPTGDMNVQTATMRTHHKLKRARRFRLRPRGALNELNDSNEKQEKLQKLLQQIYQAENSVKKETLEVKRLQGVVTAADRELEEASNQVRSLSSDLQEAQRVAAQRALKSHSAHLQLSAHDQLMFTARQRVDALSAQAVAVQAEIGMWPGSAVYNTFYNSSFPQEAGENQRFSGPAYPQDMMGGMEKAPIIYRNVPPQFYPVVSNGFQFVPLDGAYG
ncbi:hypothetical protein GE061_012591 [Apolygus lucorum]|uniref:Uncharacterized protein n=1 Tax=Apolygus lucorum TaxID=248454 RepID=A0A6A4JVN4_APOLU|nr:hypothetical protein GE061_012591 [Apolygus lucorum]